MKGEKDGKMDCCRKRNLPEVQGGRDDRLCGSGLFFVLLSFVPFIMLLLTAVQMIPAISQAEFMELVVAFTPEDYKSLAFRMVNDLSLKSPATMVSLTAVTAYGRPEGGCSAWQEGWTAYGERRRNTGTLSAG